MVKVVTSNKNSTVKESKPKRVTVTDEVSNTKKKSRKFTYYKR